MIGLPMTPRQQQIITLLQNATHLTISAIHKTLPKAPSIPTLNRDLTALIDLGYIKRTGQGRAISYSLSPAHKILAPLYDDCYFDTPADDRPALRAFNHDIMDQLKSINLLTKTEQSLLKQHKQTYQKNVHNYPPTLYQKEMERLTIELSWKSSEIEGNTYSLLETEVLFKEREQAIGKPPSDAHMLLNHKTALSCILDHHDIANHLSTALIEDIHRLLIADLDVTKNIRTRTVGITGSLYKPLDNAYQIQDKLRAFCDLINHKNNAFEKALLATLLISYIQPFEDGNKRTARMIGNALLINDNICPLSYRSVTAIDYKKATLLFYEQNNIHSFKQLFMEQVAFSAQTYFQ
jgi:Fic family protein